MRSDENEKEQEILKEQEIENKKDKKVNPSIYTIFTTQSSTATENCI